MILVQESNQKYTSAGRLKFYLNKKLVCIDALRASNNERSNESAFELKGRTSMKLRERMVRSTSRILKQIGKG